MRHSLKDVPGADGKTTLQLLKLKTSRSRRTLELPAKVAEALRSLRTVQGAEKLRLGPYLCAAAGIGPDWYPA